MLFFCCCPSGWIYKSSTYRQKAGKLAAGPYWKIGDDSYKQEAREDRFSVYCHFNSKQWWITCHPLLPPFKNPGAIQTADTDRMELLVAEFLIADRV